MNFIYVNEHGDTKISFHEKFEGKFVYDFSSIKELNEDTICEYEDENKI